MCVRLCVRLCLCGFEIAYICVCVRASVCACVCVCAVIGNCMCPPDSLPDVRKKNWETYRCEIEPRSISAEKCPISVYSNQIPFSFDREINGMNIFSSSGEQTERMGLCVHFYPNLITMSQYFYTR